MPSAMRHPVLLAPETKPPLRTSSIPPVARRKTLQLLLVFVTLVLILNALIGDRGLMETLRARQKHAEIATAIERLRSDNARLREEIGRLRSDPWTIEAVARQELGLLKPGEILFIIKDARPAAASGH